MYIVNDNFLKLFYMLEFFIFKFFLVKILNIILHYQYKKLNSLQKSNGTLSGISARVDLIDSELPR